MGQSGVNRSELVHTGGHLLLLIYLLSFSLRFTLGCISDYCSINVTVKKKKKEKKTTKKKQWQLVVHALGNTGLAEGRWATFWRSTGRIVCLPAENDTYYP